MSLFLFQAARGIYRDYYGKISERLAYRELRPRLDISLKLKTKGLCSCESKQSTLILLFFANTQTQGEETK